LNAVRAGALYTLGAALVLIGLYLLYWVRTVIVILLVAIIFAQAISPLVIRLRRLGARRTQAVLVVYFGLALLIGGLVFLLQQALFTEVANLMASLPDLQRRLAEQANMIPFRQGREIALAGIGTLAEPQLPMSGEVPARVVETGVTLLEVLFGAFSVFVVTFYWTAERLTIRRSVLLLLPAEHRERGQHIWDDVERRLGDWVRGQLVLMAFVALTFAIGFTVLGVKYAVLLAVFAGLVKVVPLVGPTLVTIPPVLVALTQSLQLGLSVAIFCVVVQVIEGNFLLPRVLSRSTGVSPLTVVLGILIGAKLMGIPGALLAVPVAAGLQVLLDDLGVFKDSSTPTDRSPRQATESERPPAPITSLVEHREARRPPS
jgi:predicted PurR-regulated permease PerM